MWVLWEGEKEYSRVDNFHLTGILFGWVWAPRNHVVGAQKCGSYYSTYILGGGRPPYLLPIHLKPEVLSFFSSGLAMKMTVTISRDLTVGVFLGE